MRVIFVSMLLSLQAMLIFSSDSPKPLRCQTWDTPCVITLSNNIKSINLQDIPGLGSDRIDPLIINSVKLEQGGLTLELKDSKVEGFSNLVLNALRASTNETTGFVKYQTDLIITGLYKTNGSLLYIPVSGEGDYWVLLKNFEIEVIAPYLMVNKINGVDYVEATDFNYRFEAKDDSEFRINDQTYGNSILSDVMQYLLNYNAKFVTSLFGKEFLAKFADEIAAYHRSLFSSSTIPVKY